MNSLDQAVTENALLLFLGVFAVTLIVLVCLGRTFPTRIVTTAAIAVAGAPIAVLAGTIGILLVAMWLNPAAVFYTVSKDPLAALAYFLETGTEFSIAGFVSILIFCYVQISKIRSARGARRLVLK